jgi:tetratricopeptide (TPR) repeat protein
VAPGRGVSAAAVAFVLVGGAGADTITLKNGRMIEADRAWVEGNQVRYQKDGGVYGVPRNLVQNIDQRPTPEPVSDPDTKRARELLAVDPAEAVRAASEALKRDPNAVPALQVMAEARLKLGDAFAARQNIEKALRQDDRDARSWNILGDAMAGLGDRATAEAHWRKSLLLRPDPSVQRKVGPAPASPPPVEPSRAFRASSFPEAQFRLSYDGGVNEPLGKEVMAALGQAYSEYAARLGFHPETPVRVTLQMTARITDGRAPEWADGWNDGSIRVPVQGLERPTPRLIQVLRHELAHSFVTARTGNNCPTWLQEGIAQWLEGGDPAREDAPLRPIARAGRLKSLLTLEGPFRGLGEADANLAYGQSLSAVNHLLRTSGETGLVRLLSALGERLPSEEALPVALGLSYPEFQRSWEQALRAGEGASKPAAGAAGPR